MYKIVVLLVSKNHTHPLIIQTRSVFIVIGDVMNYN